MDKEIEKLIAERANLKERVKELSSQIKRIRECIFRDDNVVFCEVCECFHDKYYTNDHLQSRKHKKREKLHNS